MKKIIIGKTEIKPFTIVTFEEGEGEEKKKKHFITCGNLRLPEEYETFEEAEEKIKRKDWDIIGLMVEQFMTWTINNLKQE